MPPEKKDIAEIRRLGMRLLKLACATRPSPDDLRFAHRDFQRLKELTEASSNVRLNDFYMQEVSFGREMLGDLKIQKICRPKRSDRSVWATPVPFESDRSRH